VVFVLNIDRMLNILHRHQPDRQAISIAAGFPVEASLLAKLLKSLT